MQGTFGKQFPDSRFFTGVSCADLSIHCVMTPDDAWKTFHNATRSLYNNSKFEDQHLYSEDVFFPELPADQDSESEPLFLAE